MMGKLSDFILPVYRDEFWRTNKTYVVVKGSRGSGKSKQTALWHIVALKKYPEANVLVVRKVERTIRDSCYSDLRWAIHQLGDDNSWMCTVNPLEITYKSTGQKILFRGLDDPYKITSISVPKGVLNFLWIEEFSEIGDEASFDTLNESIRGVLPTGYWKRVTMTFNPWSEHHFSKKRFFDTPADDVLAMTTTYLDNPHLSDTDRKLFEDMKVNNPRRFRVAGLGEWGIAEGLIYENFRVADFDVDKLRRTKGIKSAFNLDFGYTDPNAFVCELVDNDAKKIYVFDEWYGTGYTNKQIADQIKKMGYGGQAIICDSAEPKSIAELQEEGIKAKPSRKGRDSVTYGIQLIQNYEIIIHPRCVEFQREISNYCWAKNPNGKLTDKPDHEFSHGMDSLRYGVSDILMPPLFSFD